MQQTRGGSEQGREPCLSFCIRETLTDTLYENRNQNQYSTFDANTMGRDHSKTNMPTPRPDNGHHVVMEPHIDEIQRKASKTICALSSLGNSEWRVKLKDMKNIYRGVVILQIMYACLAWSNTNSGTQRAPYTQAGLAKIESL